VRHTINANLDLLKECYIAKTAEDRRELENQIEDLRRKLNMAERRIEELEEHLKLEKEANLLD
jgi:predicted ribosome quality control (RQC) complex YloA/Tae2 family protein